MRVVLTSADKRYIIKDETVHISNAEIYPVNNQCFLIKNIMMSIRNTVGSTSTVKCIYATILGDKSPHMISYIDIVPNIDNTASISQPNLDVLTEQNTNVSLSTDGTVAAEKACIFYQVVEVEQI